MPDGLCKVSVFDVRVAVPAGAGVEAGMVTLREDDSPYRSLQIVIGQPEARAIQSAWTGTVASRPSTWDLFVSTLGVLDVRLARAVVTSVEDQRHFFANIEIEYGDESRPVPARPSDAIALAVRAHECEILVAEGVLDELGQPADHLDN